MNQGFTGAALSNCQQIRARLISDQPSYEDDTDSELEYPLTPPLSETSGSRPISPAFEAQLGMVTLQVSDLRAPKPYKTRRNVLKRRRSKPVSVAFLPSSAQELLQKRTRMLCQYR